MFGKTELNSFKPRSNWANSNHCQAHNSNCALPTELECRENFAYFIVSDRI
ncbi:MAG: hypothetical protein AAFR62_20150 [Cyanobacteria bacterium J06629_2]